MNGQNYGQDRDTEAASVGGVVGEQSIHDPDWETHTASVPSKGGGWEEVTISTPSKALEARLEAAARERRLAEARASVDKATRIGE